MFSKYTVMTFKHTKSKELEAGKALWSQSVSMMPHRAESIYNVPIKMLQCK